jgi:hypothetical protein
MFGFSLKRVSIWVVCVCSLAQAVPVVDVSDRVPSDWS